MAAQRFHKKIFSSCKGRRKCCPGTNSPASGSVGNSFLKITENPDGRAEFFSTNLVKHLDNGCYPEARTVTRERSVNLPNSLRCLSRKRSVVGNLR